MASTYIWIFASIKSGIIMYDLSLFARLPSFHQFHIVITHNIVPFIHLHRAKNVLRGHVPCSRWLRRWEREFLSPWKSGHEMNRMFEYFFSFWVFSFCVLLKSDFSAAKSRTGDDPISLQAAAICSSYLWQSAQKVMIKLKCSSHWNEQEAKAILSSPLWNMSQRGVHKTRSLICFSFDPSTWSSTLMWRQCHIGLAFQTSVGAFGFPRQNTLTKVDDQGIPQLSFQQSLKSWGSIQNTSKLYR